MKNITNKIARMGLSISFLIIFNSCGLEQVERQEVIAACENRTDPAIECDDCCKSNGFDAGTVDKFSSTDKCECIDYVDD